MLYAEARHAGKWYAEYARAQFAPSTACASQPAWLAWLLCQSGVDRETFLALWAEDGRAGRRALQAEHYSRDMGLVRVLRRG